MKKPLLYFFALICSYQLSAQNLVVNGDAESLPRGAGWTVVSQGAITCLLVPTNNMVNWTMKPDGSANYPFDHTIGAAGGTVFFSGCDTYFTGPFEVKQDIDLTADAALIDAGGQLYDFSGYMQSPVSPQTDIGRIVVDFKDAADAVLGGSYVTGWQSNFGGSGAGWVHYANTRVAPASSRKVTIRLQTMLYINQPAINVYFDDITFQKSIVTPLGLLYFKGIPEKDAVDLDWKLSGELAFKQFDVERSTDAVHYSHLTTQLASQLNNYHYTDTNIPAAADKYFYRLKLTGMDGKITYSNVVLIKPAGSISLDISPNPASNILSVSGFLQPGIISVISSNGSTVFSNAVKSAPLNIDIAKLPEGVYVVRFSNANTTVNKKLLIRH